MGNSEIADLFDEVADLLEIQAANPFRVRAYRNASRVIRGWPVSLAGLVSSGIREGISTEHLLPKMPGIGKDLAEKIIESIQTRDLALLKALRQETPRGLLALLRLPGLGPKRVARLQGELGVRGAQDLKRVIRNGSLRSLTGFGEKIEQKLLQEVQEREKEPRGAPQRTPFVVAEPTVEALLTYLRRHPGVVSAEIAGSFRRRQKTVGDLDFLVACKNTKEQSRIIEYFSEYSEIREVLAQGSTRSTVILNSGLQADLRVVEESSFGAALHYFTGSKAHNVAIRTLGLKQGLKINEYGVFRGTRRLGGRTEAEVFASVKLPYIEPELRENEGEIEAASQGGLPELIELEEIRGDLHAHSKATDGRLSITEMAEAAQKMGYEYLAITDHSRHLTVARGLDSKRLMEQIREIDRLNARLKGFRILKATEVDILKDGSLDHPESLLSQLDLVVGSIHSHFELSPQKQLDRVLRAMDHPYFHILGHPSARLIGRRRALALDLEKVIQGAVDRGCALELNAQPERMDLSDRYCRLAKKMGAWIVISTDAHSDHDLRYMKLGVAEARRGWLEAKDVLNTRSWAEIARIFRKTQGRQLAA